MDLQRVVTTSTEVAATRSRVRKRELLSSLLIDAPDDEVTTIVAWLSGEIPGGRIGVGWRSLAALDVPIAPASSLQVVDVSEALAQVATTRGAGSVAARQTLLAELFSAATAPEQRFLTALLTGELRQGALGGVMADAIAVATTQPPDLVRRAHMLTGSLPKTAHLALHGGEAALLGVGLEVGRPIGPMLASPADSLDTALESLGAHVIVDYKLDGARIQVHRRDDEVTVFTRSLRDITASVPGVVDTVLELDCRTAIFDGESLSITEEGRPRAFQDTMSAAAVLRPYLFDCLHLDGRDLIDAPLRERLEALDGVAGHLRVPSILDPTPEQAAAQLDSSLADGHEGVMVKDLSSVYAAGRRGKAWQKVKPVHTFDLVVLAAEWGSGRRRGMLSNIHLGARGPDGSVMVGKTFKGLTDKLLAWQTSEFPEHETRRDDHTVYLRPELVVEIELDGVQRSSRYPGGVALRFARVVRYRPDKSVDDIDTLDSLRALLK